MIDVLHEEQETSLTKTERRIKRRMYRNLAIQALDGYIHGTVKEDDYMLAVAEYQDVIREIGFKGEYNA